MFRYSAALLILSFWCSFALAQTVKQQPSTCLAIARDLQTPDLPVRFASFTHQANEQQYSVRISYQGHSTYLIESPAGLKVATDYAGWMRDTKSPDVVTMNHAHSSHYTDNPDPKIKHVFRGWPRNGKIAEYHDLIEDVLVRNVTTDVLRFGTEKDGNSIFIFEVAGLCIGHLGHLHHKLDDSHYSRIGRLDVVMVPVDGGLTMSHVSAKEILARLRSSVVLPMHVRSFDAMPRFLNYLGNDYPVQRPVKNELVLSLRNLPKQPTVFILPGVDSYVPPDE